MSIIGGPQGGGAGALGAGVGLAELEVPAADGAIIIGDGAGAPVEVAAFASSAGVLKIANGGTASTTAAAAATALGVGTGDSPQFTAVNIGHASDTTLTKTAAGKVAVEGKAVPLMSGASDLVIAGPTVARTLTLPDADVTVTAAGAALLDDAAASNQRTTLGLGTLAVENVAAVPSLTMADAANIALDTTTGTKIGTATTQKLGFFNATPVVQQAAVANPSGGAVIDTECRAQLSLLLNRMRTLGFVAP